MNPRVMGIDGQAVVRMPSPHIVHTFTFLNMERRIQSITSCQCSRRHPCPKVVRLTLIDDGLNALDTGRRTLDPSHP